MPALHDFGKCFDGESFHTLPLLIHILPSGSLDILVRNEPENREPGHPLPCTLPVRSPPVPSIALSAEINDAQWW